jgi:hypothetical protein
VPHTAHHLGHCSRPISVSTPPADVSGRALTQPRTEKPLGGNSRRATLFTHLGVREKMKLVHLRLREVAVEVQEEFTLDGNLFGRLNP